MALLPGDDAPYRFSSIARGVPAGATLHGWLSTRFPYHSPEEWLAIIVEGRVEVAGTTAPDPLLALREGDDVAYVHGDYAEPDVPTDWRVLDRGEHWLAISKPAGQPVHTTGRIFRQTLVWQVRKIEGQRWSPVHRLDRDTSGLVLFAGSPEALRWLGGAFTDRRVEKRYLALLRGNLAQAVEVDRALGPSGDPETPSRVGVREDGKSARTVFEPIVRHSGHDATWTRVRPREGRRHQIRVHAEWLGHPIEGDLLYDGNGGRGYRIRASGGSAADVAAAAGSPRMWLHAESLELQGTTLPLGLPRRLECPLPEAAALGLG